MQRRTKNRIRPSPSTPSSSGIELFWQWFARLALSQLAFTQLAILHAAIYDAVNNIEPRFSPYLVHLPDVPRSASKIAAADEAAHDVLVFLYPAFQVSLNTEQIGRASCRERV